MFFSHWLEATSCALTFLITGVKGRVPFYDHGLPTKSSDTPKGHLGGVASENKICSNIGRELLLKGGNAADAMVGTTFCVGVIGMYHSGIGGGGFALVRDEDGEYEYVDFRETAPAAAWQDMYNNDTLASIFGGLASGVPGEVRGLAYIHQRYGKLPWREIMQGAIKIARDGWPVGGDLVRYMAASLEGQKTNFLVEDPTWAIDFAPNGTLLGLGDIITRKRYAATLETIAERGPDTFYEGPMAEAMIQTIQTANGTMTIEDLSNYTVAIRDPVEITYRGYKLRSVAAPASGGVTLAILKILEGYDDMGSPAHMNLSTHRLDEATRFGYGMRASMGDPDFVANMSHYQQEILSPGVASSIRGKISDTHTLNTSAYDPGNLEILDTPGTSHIVTADESGMAISLTTTVNLLFGSQLMDPSTGIIMNNEMNDFSIPGRKNAFGLIPSEANYIRPGKRPFSSIACTIAETADGELYFVTGAAGGSRIITATMQTLWHVLDRGLSAQESLAEPRLHDQLSPNTAVVERGYDLGTVEYLMELGHNVTWIDMAQSSAQCLRRLGDGSWDVGSEPRQVDSGAFAI